MDFRQVLDSRTPEATRLKAILSSAALLILSGALVASPSRSASLLSPPPRLVLWAWERPTNLEFINPSEVGVAFLAQTIYLRDDRAVTRPRLQPLRIPPGANLTAVVRIEPDRAHASALNPQQRTEVISAILTLTRLPAISGIQIDFDASTSQRAFYRQLLIDLRRQLPPSFVLSITALASWCTYDNWLADLPIDDAVPMLFRMGRDEWFVRHYLKSGKDFRPALCRQSLGISTDEWLPVSTLGRRAYVFHPGPWSADLVEQLHDAVLRTP